MNLIKLKYFIDLVESGSFTKTGELNHVSQTSISQQLRSLEEQFGHVLIDRSVKPVRATEQGQLLYREAKLLWAQYLKLEKTMADSAGVCHTIRIAYTSITELSYLRPVTSFIEDELGLEVEILKITMKEAAEVLTDQKADLVLCFDTTFAPDAPIKRKVLYKGMYEAIVGSEHPLYHRKYIEGKEVGDYPLVMMSRKVLGISYDIMIQRCREDGYEPILAKIVDDVDTELYFVREQNLMCLFPEIFPLSSSHGEIRMIPLRNSHHKFGVILAYDPNYLHSGLQEAVKAIFSLSV